MVIAFMAIFVNQLILELNLVSIKIANFMAKLMGRVVGTYFHLYSVLFRRKMISGK
jgi:hypothetical protein